MKVKKLIEKYALARYANRGMFFAKRNPIDLTTIEGINEHFSSGHIEGVVCNFDDKDVVMIFGSNQIKDWLFNLFFKFTSETPYPSVTRKEIKVHTGFYRSYLEIRDFMLNKFKDNKELVIYGQSLGGAVAQFAALDLQYNYPDMKIKLITTGAPRVGNNEFKKSFNKRFKDYKRYSNGNDMITVLPPKIFGFVHVCDEFALSKPRKIRLSIRNHLVPQYLENFSNKYSDLTAF